MQVFSYSSYNKQDVPGECTEEALNARDVRWTKQRPVKEPKERAPVKETGIPAEDGEDLGIEYRLVTSGAEFCCSCVTYLENPNGITFKVLFQIHAMYTFNEHTNVRVYRNARQSKPIW